MPESARKSTVILIYAALAICTVLVFRQVGSFDFVRYDDDNYVYENPHVSGGLTRDSVLWAFTAGHASNWHPLTWLSLMLDCQLFGLKPGWMHIVNVILHIANTILLFALLRRVTGALWQSVFVAAAFAVHPMHVESVAWITERKDVLSTFFLLLTIFAYVGYVRRRGPAWYLLAVVLFVLGLMAKPMLVTLPLLLLLLDYWPLKRFGDKPARWSLVIEKIPFAILAAVVSVITFLVHRAGGAMADAVSLPLHSRLANALLSYVKYLEGVFWPENLAVLYPLDVHAIGALHAVLCLLLLVAVSVPAVYYGRRHGYLILGWFWFVITLIPVIGFVQVGRQAFADRYTYISYIGVFIVIAWGLPELVVRWPQRKLALGLAMAAFLTTMGVCAYRQVGYWQDSITLFTRAIAVTHDNHFVYSSRGIVYDELGRSGEALQDFRQAVKLRPDSAESHTNLGNLCGKLGLLQEAMEHLKEAASLKPDSAESYVNLGNAYSRAGRWQDAIDAYQRAIVIRPDIAGAHYNLAYEFAGRGRYNEAVWQFREAVRLAPDWPDCMSSLAMLIATHPQVTGRDANEAINLAERACRLSGYRNPAFLDSLAAAYASGGRFSEAVDTAQKAMAFADVSNQPQMKGAIEYHLSFYLQGKPYVEPVMRPSPDSNRQ